MSAENPVFRVVEYSETAHCCFEATVVDTSKPLMIRGEHYNGRYEPVCECMDRADAETVCAALNAAEDAARYRKLCEPGEWPDAVEAAFDCSSKSAIDIAVDEFRSTSSGGPT